ncbi:MAG: hypothetical protein HON55_04560 [Legionellales bacterium]|jgi:hypothetical protein|nr:hypothetical protein [Legionellales bacterium]
MSFSNEDKKMLTEHFTVNQLEAINYMVGNSHTSESGKDYYIDEIATGVDSLSDLKIKMDEALGHDDSGYDVSVFTGGNDEPLSKEDLAQTKMGLQKINDSQSRQGSFPFFSAPKANEGGARHLESLIDSINKPVEKFIPPGQ